MIHILLPTKRQCQALIFPIPLLVVFGYYPIFHNHAHSFLHHGGMLMLAILAGLLCWVFSIIANNCISYKISHPDNTFIRGASIFTLMLFVTTALLVLIVYGPKGKPSPPTVMSMDSMVAGMILVFGTNILLCSIWQTDLVLDQLKNDLMAKDLFEKRQLNSQYYRLKQQINPGFLFNNFTILSSLISEDAVRAVNYLDKLSTVYRYLLKQADNGFSSLNSELEFLNSYQFLLQERYQGSVLVSIEEQINSKMLIPTLALHLLIENAIKHNRCSVHEPLHIRIRKMSPTSISLSNNLQLRKNPIGVHSEGLREIKARYLDFGFPEVLITNDGHHFNVVLPLV